MPARPNTQALIDLIYASLLGERPWQDFVDELSRILPNGKALLFFHDTSAGAGAFSLNGDMDPVAAQAYGSYYSSVNPWMRGACTRRLGRVVRADAMFPHEQLIGTEFYNDFLRPQQIESGIGVTVLREQHCNFMLSVLSAEADDETYDEAIACVQALVPHLQRAFNWYRKEQSSVLGLVASKGLSQHLRAGVITVGPGRKVHSLNDIAADVLRATPELSIDRVGHLNCAKAEVTECLDAMLTSHLREQPAAAPVSFLLPSANQSPPLRLTIVPSPADPDVAYFRGPECIVLFESPTGDVNMAANEFGLLHRLTVAETRVVAGLAEGHTVDAIALRSGTSVETVRKQLKQVFAKTGLSRQVDLVRTICLLAGTLLTPF